MARDSVEEIQQAAEEQAARLSHKHVGTEHLLLAILQMEDSAATQALWSLGVDVSRARSTVQSALAKESPARKTHARVTPKARDILERAAVSLTERGTPPSVSILSDLCTERTAMATRLLAVLGVTQKAFLEALDRSK